MNAVLAAALVGIFLVVLGAIFSYNRGEGIHIVLGTGMAIILVTSVCYAAS